MLKIIKHKFISNELLDAVIDIKSTAWDYSYESHLKWIKENLKDEDLHFMIFKNNKIVGYLNLVNVILFLNNIQTTFIGIGNVCTRYNGQGQGSILMNKLNKYIIDSKSSGLLFCKKDLLAFYVKFNWVHVDNSLVEFSFTNTNPNTHIMIFNNTIQFNKIAFRGELF